MAGEFGVPGAALGIACGAESVEVAWGVTNVDTGVAVTPETLFQLGSIGKVWTATVVMRLVEQGKLDLDAPVVTYLPELRLADHAVSRAVTMRHLLTHTSGIDADFYGQGTGRGDDCLSRYVQALAERPLTHPMGATWSYCNAGFVVAGRVIEKLTGQVWDTAMRELLYAPLGLTHTVTMPEDALLYRTAVGHVHKPDEKPRRAPVWTLSRAMGPAGLITSTVGDVLSFARMHLSGGVAGNRTRILSAESVSAMQRQEAILPDPHMGPDSWGLGWSREDWGGVRLIGHSGITIGQAAYLRILPAQDLAVVLLTNGGRFRELDQALIRQVFHDLAGVEMPAPVTPPAPRPLVDVGPRAGTYQRSGERFEVWQDAGGARIRMTTTLDIEGVAEESAELDLVPVRDGLFVVREACEQMWTPVKFYELADGGQYLHHCYHATPKANCL
jgi:CubicO group peptidase (beta-lactamase class C family)